MKPEHKYCPMCQEEKPISEYYQCYAKDRGKYRSSSYCKLCSKKRGAVVAKKHYWDNREKKLEYCREYRKKNKDSIRVKKRGFKEKYIKELHPCYVAEQASKVVGVSQALVRKQPGMVEAYTTLLKIKRRIRDGKK